MNEISYYEPFSKIFSKYLANYLGKEYAISYVHNKTYDNIVSEFESEYNTKIQNSEKYIPKLKLDIVFAIKKNSEKVVQILIEAKFKENLSLKDFSQLVGYLQVATKIDIGLLLIIQNGYSVNRLSNDLNELIRFRQLPMDWYIEKTNSKQKIRLKTGIIYFNLGSPIGWEDTKMNNGFSSFDELVSYIKMIIE